MRRSEEDLAPGRGAAWWACPVDKKGMGPCTSGRVPGSAAAAANLLPWQAPRAPHEPHA